MEYTVWRSKDTVCNLHLDRSLPHLGPPAIFYTVFLSGWGAEKVILLHGY